MDRWDDLFALVEKRFHDDRRRLAAPTAVLRLKQAIAAEANANVCLAALQDLRAAMGREIDARRDLSRRCKLLDAKLRDLQRADDGASPRAAIAAPLEDPGGREPTAQRISFSERLAHVFGTRAPSSLAVLRIGFGSMEDLAVEGGSPALAQLLHITSSRISNALRSGDIVTPFDSEGLACALMELPSREQLTHLACKMIDLLSEPMSLAERQIALSASIGIAAYPADGKTPDELIATAGDAMHRARAQETRYAFSDAHAEIWASQFSNLGEI